MHWSFRQLIFDYPEVRKRSVQVTTAIFLTSQPCNDNVLLVFPRPSRKSCEQTHGECMQNAILDRVNCRACWGGTQHGMSHRAFQVLLAPNAKTGIAAVNASERIQLSQQICGRLCSRPGRSKSKLLGDLKCALPR